jgi:hypothetical protein
VGMTDWKMQLIDERNKFESLFFPGFQKILLQHSLFAQNDSFDEIVKSRKTPFFVIPAKVGIQLFQALIDSRLRGNDVWDLF